MAEVEGLVTHELLDAHEGAPVENFSRAVRELDTKEEDTMMDHTVANLGNEKSHIFAMGGYGHDDGRNRDLVLNAIHQASSLDLTNQGSNARAVLDSLCNVKGDITESVNRNGSAGLAATLTTSGDIRRDVCAGQGDIRREVATGFGTLGQLVTAVGCKTDDRVSDGFAASANAVGTGFTAVQVALTGGFKDVANGLCGLEGRLANQATENTHRVLLQAQSFESLAQARHAEALRQAQECC